MGSKEQDDQTQPHVAHDHESQTPTKQGGWITLPFILGTFIYVYLINFLHLLFNSFVRLYEACLNLIMWLQF